MRPTADSFFHDRKFRRPSAVGVSLSALGAPRVSVRRVGAARPLRSVAALRLGVGRRPSGTHGDFVPQLVYESLAIMQSMSFACLQFRPEGAARLQSAIMKSTLDCTLAECARQCVDLEICNHAIGSLSCTAHFDRLETERGSVEFTQTSSFASPESHARIRRRPCPAISQESSSQLSRVKSEMRNEVHVCQFKIFFRCMACISRYISENLVVLHQRDTCNLAILQFASTLLRRDACRAGGAGALCELAPQMAPLSSAFH